MARSWLVMVGGLLAACQADPGLHVTVTHPPNLSASITYTTVSIYAATNLKCEQVEFAEVSDDTLTGALVGEIDIDATKQQTTGSLAGVTRDDDKLVVARGYTSAGGALYAAGCVPVGDVTSSQDVTIPTVAAATISVGAADDTTDTIGRKVQVSDPLGALLDARPVSWTVFAPSGASPNGSAAGAAGSDVWVAPVPSCTDVNGAVTIHPVPPLQVAGYEVQIHASWEAGAVPLYSQTALPAMTTTPLANIPANPLLGANVCTAFASKSAAGVAGTDLACVVASAGSPAIGDWALPLAGSGFELHKSVTVPSDVIGVVTQPSTGAPYAVELGGALLAIDFAAGTAAGAGSICPGGACAVQGLATLPACGSGDQERVLAEVDASTTTYALGTFDAAPAIAIAGLDLDIKIGMTSTPAAVASLDAAGCVTVENDSGVQTVRPSFVIDLFITKATKTASITRAFYTCGMTSVAPIQPMWCHVDLPFAGGGVGYSPLGPAPSLDGSSFGAQGATVLAWTLGSRLIQRASLPSASLPEQIVFGKFEANDTTDLLWDIPSKRGTAIELSYSVVAEGSPLSAVAGLDQVTTTLVTGDFDGDDYTDIAQVSEIDIGMNVAYSITALPTGANAAPITVLPDLACPSP